MKRIIASIIAVMVCVGLCTITNAGPAKIKVLLIDGQNNHDWKSQTPVLKPLLENSGRFTVDVSTAPGKKAAKKDWDNWRPGFSKYDAIFSNYNGQSWPEPVQTSFEKFVREGGGFVLIHAADNAFGKWKEYNMMIGVGGWGGRTEKTGPYVHWKDGKIVRDMSAGSGGTHGAQRKFVINTRVKDHPITKDFPAAWKHTKDELYANLRGPAENMTVLSTAYSLKTKKHEPVLMVINYGKGRVFHNVLGHDVYSMNCAGFITTIQRGTEWAATGKVTIPVPDNFPGLKKAVVMDATKKVKE